MISLSVWHTVDLRFQELDEQNVYMDETQFACVFHVQKMTRYRDEGVEFRLLNVQNIARLVEF